MSDAGEVLAFDVGGTHLRGARVRASGAGGELGATTRADTPRRDGDALVAALAEAVERLDPEGACPALGLAMAGLIDRRAGTLRLSPSLELRDVPLGPELERRTGRRVLLVNDVNAAALGEARAAHCDDLAAIFVGTGVGTGFVCGGRLLEGHRGLAGEGGHVVHRPGGRPGPAGVDGCFEAYLGGRCLAERARAAGVGDDAEALLAAWRRGEPAAREPVEDALTALHALVQLVETLFDPEALVIGGGVAAGFPELLDAARRAVREHPLGSGRRDLRVEPARLGDRAGLLGAAAVARAAAG